MTESTEEIVEEIEWKEYVEICRVNGFEYVIVGRPDYIPFVDWFEMRDGMISIPCRNIDDGQNVILSFLGDGFSGHFYVRKMIFPEDGWITALTKFVSRWCVTDLKYWKNENDTN